MSLPKLTIEPRRSRSRRTAQKSRIFSARLLGYIVADPLWDGGSRSDDVLRPVHLAFFGTERESAAVVANLRSGEKAKALGERLQIPKRAGFRWLSQKVPGGIVTTVYLPELFHLEPAVPFPEDLRFVFLPPRWWLEREAELLAPEFGEDALDAARGALFAAYVDRRTPLPLIHDLRFHLELYRAAKASSWVQDLVLDRKRGRGLWAESFGADGLDHPLAVSVGHEALGEFVVEQTSIYHRKEISRGTTRLASDRRLLPHPFAAPAQLCLDLALE